MQSDSKDAFPQAILPNTTDLLTYSINYYALLDLPVYVFVKHCQQILFIILKIFASTFGCGSVGRQLAHLSHI